jgi:predicted phage tail protein
MNKIIKGAKGGKGSGGSGRTPVEAPDSLRSIQYANVLDLISEGEIKGLVNGAQSVYLDDTPLQNEDGSYNFSGVTLYSRNGTQSQEIIAGFDDAEAETAVGVEITHDTPVVRTISNVNDNAVRVTVSIPSLTNQNLSNGDLNGTSVQIAIDVQSNGGGFVEYPLSRIYSASYFENTGSILKNTVDTTKFKITSKWTGEGGAYATTLQSCSIKLQYRAVGDVSWLDYESYNFSGAGSTYQQSIDSNSVIGYLYSQTVYVAPTGTKTFEVTLANGQYEFQLVKLNGSRGATSGVAYGGAASIQSGEGYFPVYTDTISGKTTSKYQRAYRVELTGSAPWDIRVRRITADSTSTSLNNKTYWDSYTEIISAKLNYPNSALFGLQIDASQFNSIPRRGYEADLILIKIPSNYDPITREYTGTWDGTFNVEWSNNAAWVLYDIVTNDRYGLGQIISETMIDKWTLYTIGQYCDEMVPDGFGGLEPRFTCNIYLQTREQAYQVVMNLASVFRSMIYISAGSVYVAQDAPKDVSQIFSAANVIDGEFNYSGSSVKVRHSVVLVTWNDPQDAYNQKIEYVSDDDAIARYGVVQTEIVAVGCTSRGQAARIGRWLLYSEQYEPETITFKAALDTVYLQPGDVIEVNHANRAGKRLGGRLIASSVSTITLDAEIQIEAGKTYEITCVLPDKTLETRSITNAPGLHSAITLSADFSQAPQVYAMWIVSINDLVPEQWRVISISESNKINYEITALTYRSDKYNAVEQDLVLEPLPLSILNGGLPNIPENLNIVESLYLAGIGVVGVKATVSWNSQLGINGYVLTYQKENENPISITTSDTTVEIKPLIEGNYTFKVYATNTLGKKSQSAIVSKTIYGKILPPVTIENFNVSKINGIAQASWLLHPDLDVQVGGNIVVRHTPKTIGATWQDGVIVEAFTGNSSSGVMPLMTGTYFAKALDSSGNYSENAVSFIATEGMVTGFNTVATITESPNFDGLKTNVAAINSQLKITCVSKIGEMVGDVSTWPKLSTLGGINASGEYEFDQMFDLTTVATRRIEADIDALNFDVGNSISQRGLVSLWGSVIGEVVNDCDATLYYASTDDDPLATPTWSDWTQFFVADVTARALKFKLVLESENSQHNILINTLRVDAKVPV